METVENLEQGKKSTETRMTTFISERSNAYKTSKKG